MRMFGMTMLVAVGLMLAGCGSNTHVAGSINGNWTATLTSSGPDTFTFITFLTGHADGSLGSSNFSFTVNNTDCFPSTTTQAGSFVLQGNFNGKVMGSFHYIITGAEGSILTLDGMVKNGQITGTWTLSGSTGCSGNGNFTMVPA